MNNTVAFPDHNIDPKKKDKAWRLQFAKAAWNSWSIGMPVGSIFAAKAARMAEIADYAMGRQSINKYKKQLLPEDSQDESYDKIDWTPPTNGMVLRNIAVAKVQKAGYNIIATAINPLAKDAQDEEYAAQRVKIMMREAMQQQAPELADDPSLKKMPGEADDLEELQMEIDHNPKYIRSRDIEQSIQLVFYENEMQKILDLIAEDVVDHGVGVIKEGLDENNKVVLRRVYLDMFGCSYTRKPDFSDITWAFELHSTKLSDLAKHFGESDMEIIKNSVTGKNGNPQTFGNYSSQHNGYDIFKANVMDLEFISYNKQVMEERIGSDGNIKVGKTKPSAEGKVVDGVSYTTKTVEVIYKCKWVVGTDFIYEDGLADNVKRSATIATMSKTKLSYHIQAAAFNNMRAKGMTENMIPAIDDLCIATYRLRSFLNNLIPNGLDIDIAALEGVATGQGGQTLNTSDLLELLYSKGILLSRRSGISMDQNVNYKAVNPFQVNNLDNLTAIMNALNNAKQSLREITGLNELTDGSTPNARMLTTTANLANESTNNALWYLIKARKDLLESVAKATVQRLQVALKRGPYDGYNKEAGNWITVPKSIIDYDYDLIIEDKATDDQKAVLYELMKQDIAQGFLDTSDVILVINSYNIKAAFVILAYKVKANKKKQAETANSNTQATAQAQMQSNQMAEQIKDQMAEKQMERQMKIDNNMQAWNFAIAQLKAGHANAQVEMKVAADILKSGAQMQENPQEQLAEVGMEEPVI